MEGSVYLKARQEWDERYADLVLGKRNWQITAAGMMAITLVLASGWSGSARAASSFHTSSKSTSSAMRFDEVGELPGETQHAPVHAGVKVACSPISRHS
jgi:type IV secretory pathway TrbF-like protein